MLGEDTEKNSFESRTVKRGQAKEGKPLSIPVDGECGLLPLQKRGEVSLTVGRTENEIKKKDN